MIAHDLASSLVVRCGWLASPGCMYRRVPGASLDVLLVAHGFSHTLSLVSVFHVVGVACSFAWSFARYAQKRAKSISSTAERPESKSRQCAGVVSHGAW